MTLMMMIRMMMFFRMETFEDMAEKALRLLQELLRKKSENPLTPTQIVKLATISFYAYHVANETGEDQRENGTVPGNSPKITSPITGFI